LTTIALNSALPSYFNNYFELWVQGEQEVVQEEQELVQEQWEHEVVQEEQEVLQQQGHKEDLEKFPKSTRTRRVSVNTRSSRICAMKTCHFVVA
jgi:hypothetical protein